jgi:hypothetical protein
MKRYIIAAACFGISLFLSMLFWQAIRTERSSECDAPQKVSVKGVSSSTSQDSDQPQQTKSKLRPNVPKKTVEETRRLLTETVLSRLSNDEDTTVAELVTIMNEAIQAAGVAPHELRISVNRADEVSALRIKDSLELHNITVIGALNTHFGNSKITYEVREGGRVELLDITKKLPDATDPLQPDDLDPLQNF